MQKHKNRIFYIIIVACSIVLISTWQLDIDTAQPIQNNNASEEETIFLVKNMATVQFAENINFITATTISFFLQQNKYYAEQVNAYQHPQYNKHTQQPLITLSTPTNQLFANAISHVLKESIADFHHPVRIIQRANDSVKILLGDATYHIDKQFLSSQQAVEIQSNRGNISANQMTLDVASQSLELLHQVHSVFSFSPVN